MLVIALASALPLAAFATFATLESRRALKGALLDRQAKVADERAQVIARELGALDRTMNQMISGRPLTQSSPAEIQGALSELYLRKDALSQVALISADGQALSSLFVDDPAAFARVRPEFERHPVVTGFSVEAFMRQVRAALPQPDSTRTLPYGVSSTLPDSIALLSARNPQTGERLALELRLQSFSKGVLGESDDGTVVLVDGQGLVVAGPRGNEKTYAQLSVGAPQRTSEIQFEDGTYFAARAPVRGASLSVAVLRNERDALAPLASLSFATAVLLALTLLAAVVVGAMLSRQLSFPIGRLAQGARELAKGNLKHRLAGHRVPELDDVARAFNQMAENLDAANTRLLGFNEELQKQVAERTAELREAQAQLLRSQRLGAVVDLTSGLAHELNNPLAAIIGTAQLLQLELPSQDPLQERLQPIVVEGLRISKMLKRITTLSDWERGDMAPAELNGLINRALAERDALLKETHAEVVRSFDPQLPQVLADAPALTEVVGHLIDNAHEALEGRPAKTIRLSTKTVEGQAVRFEISDTGKGIARENLERIFNPFFKTSTGGGANGKGPGLSLARCHQVIEAHGGKLTVSSEEGVGTTVALVLPAAPPRAQLV